MKMEEYSELREVLGLNKESNVLLFSTEGDTDPDRYKKIVWEGKEEVTQEGNEMEFNKIKEAAENYREDMTKFLRDLVRIPGESAGEKGHIDRIAAGDEGSGI